MFNCTQCGHGFTGMERVKAGVSLKGNIKCPNCNAVYKAEGIYRKGYYFIVIFSFVLIINKFDILSTFLDYIGAWAVLSAILIIFDFIPHRWHRYRKLQ